MSKSDIEWTGDTENCVTGCDDKSRGCKNCYARPMSHRLAGIKHSKEKYSGTTKKVGHKVAWTGEIKLHTHVLLNIIERKGSRLIFMNSMSDSFHEKVPFEFIDKIFATMALTQDNTYQIPTKRADRLAEYFTASPSELRRRWMNAAKEMGQNEQEIAHVIFPLQNVWLGVSVEDQTRADERIPYLLSVPAAVRFLSCEPLVGPVDIEKYLDPCHACRPIEYFGCTEKCPQPSPIHWVITGGESGHGADPMYPEWPVLLQQQCAAASVPFFFKQWGQWADYPHPGYTQARWVDRAGKRHDGNQDPIDGWTMMYKMPGKKLSGSVLDEKEYKEYPGK